MTRDHPLAKAENRLAAELGLRPGDRYPDWLLPIIDAARVMYCRVHGATRAIDEEPTVCWEYDGDRDCEFMRGRSHSTSVGGSSVQWRKK